MNRLALAAALLGFIGVGLGAFGAHALSDRLTLEASEWWDTATLYVLVHAGVALAISVHRPTGLLKFAGGAFVFGALIFGATLYAMALGAPRILGAITPIGGLGLLVGWALTALAAMRSRNA